MTMTLSSRVRYGVRAMFQFASHWGEGAVTPYESLRWRRVSTRISRAAGPAFVAACTDPDSGFNECARGEFCVSRLLWNEVSRKIGVAFDATTLSDLCNASRRGRAGARRSLING